MAFPTSLQPNIPATLPATGESRSPRPRRAARRCLPAWGFRPVYGSYVDLHGNARFRL